MKVLGLIGGTSWVSTIDYYRYINQGINDRLGGVNAAKLILQSFNFNDIVKLLAVNDWQAITRMLVEAGINLRNSGADAIVLCANTMHMVADEVEKQVGLPIINIATATAEKINEHQLTQVALLGTKFTMEQSFFIDKLKANGIEVLVPGDFDRDYIHHNLKDELAKGIFTDDAKSRYLGIISDLRNQGAEGGNIGMYRNTSTAKTRRYGYHTI